MRIAIAGIHIESSTFTRITTPMDRFIVYRGQEMLDHYDWSTRLGDVVEGVEFVPIVIADASAAGPVEPDVYDALEAEVVAGLAAAGPLGGVYLDMHGAMNVLGRDDAEAAYLRAIRGVVGDLPISLSMDPHGNVSRDLLELVDLATAHRHAPHIDTWATKERAVENLIAVIRDGRRPVRAWVPVPVLLHGERTSTVVEPGKTVFGRLLPAIDEYGVLDAAIWVGFAWADEPRNSAAVLVTGYDAEQAAACAAELAESYWAARDDFVVVSEHVGSFDEALDLVLETSGRVWISDSGDNVTAGSTGDITYAIEHALARTDLAERGKRVLFAGLWDPATLDAAIAAGEGAVLDLAIGAAVDDRYGAPVPGPWTVEALVPDANYPDRTAGARLSAHGIEVTVQSERAFFVDPAFPEFPVPDRSGMAWLDPTPYDAVVVKNGYLFPPQWPFVDAHVMAITPGGTDLDFDRLPIERWSRPMYPLDTDFTPDLTPVVLAPRA
jgi:microcystin degradation protein MlrC